jgi:hypothetical protein
MLSLLANRTSPDSILESDVIQEDDFGDVSFRIAAGCFLCLGREENNRISNLHFRSPLKVQKLNLDVGEVD